MYPGHEAMWYQSRWQAMVEPLYNLLAENKRCKLEDPFDSYRNGKYFKCILNVSINTVVYREDNYYYCADDERDLALLSVLPVCTGLPIRRYQGVMTKPTLDECCVAFITHSNVRFQRITLTDVTIFIHKYGYYGW